MLTEMESEVGALQGVVSPQLTAGCNWTKMSRLPGRAGIGQHPGCRKLDGVGSMKPRWIRVRKRRTQRDPEGVLQAGLLVFSATCGATLLLAACNGG